VNISLPPVPALSLPDSRVITETGSSLLSAPEALAALSPYEAVTLFLDRAVALVPGFTLTLENAQAIADICIRLDGMPLAIELAAARVNVLTVVQIADRLDNRFTLLKSEQRGVIDQRHQTLRAAVDWSYDLLTPQEQTILQRLCSYTEYCERTQGMTGEQK
jgi:non-specific serine/threonine protein kinase